MAANITDKKPGLITRISRSVKDMRGEMKRVVWSTRKQTLNNTVIVIIFMIIMAIFIGSFDAVLSMIIKYAFGA